MSSSSSSPQIRLLYVVFPRHVVPRRFISPAVVESALDGLRPLLLRLVERAGHDRAGASGGDGDEVFLPLVEDGHGTEGGRDAGRARVESSDEGDVGVKIAAVPQADVFPAVARPLLALADVDEGAAGQGNPRRPRISHLTRGRCVFSQHGFPAESSSPV